MSLQPSGYAPALRTCYTNGGAELHLAEASSVNGVNPYQTLTTLSNCRFQPSIGAQSSPIIDRALQDQLGLMDAVAVW